MKIKFKIVLNKEGTYNIDVKGRCSCGNKIRLRYPLKGLIVYWTCHSCNKGCMIRWEE